MSKPTPSHTPAPPAPAAPPPGADRTPFRYTAQLAAEIETRRQAEWAERGLFRAMNPGDEGFDPAKPPFYCLDMFPYPSGSGLHVGHPEGYTATDIISRYKRLCGFNVLHPMGWDAFGLPAEQYAIQTGVHPAETTRRAIDTFRRQLKRFGFSYDWSRELSTIDPAYYRWTQWIWLKAYGSWYDPFGRRARPIAELEADLEAGRIAFDVEGELIAPEAPAADRLDWSGLDAQRRRDLIDGVRLAYLAEQTVNWCPKLGTALANEEVIDGRSERGGHPVLRKPLRQWMFRITAFADRLLSDLDGVDWPESTRTMQREWIGRSEGAEIDFPLAIAPAGWDGDVRVYTTRPDTVFGATYMVLAPEHALVEAMLAHPRPGTDVARVRAYVEQARHRQEIDRIAETKEKTGVATGFDAINPATGERIPIWIADYVLASYGHGAIMAVPAHDDRDFDFAHTFGLAIQRVVEPIADAVAHADAVAVAATDADAHTVAATHAQAHTPAPAHAPTPAAFTGNGRAINSANPDVSLDGLPTPEAKERIISWLEATKRGRRRVNYKLRDWLFSRQRYWGEPFPIVYDEAGNHFPVDESNLPVVLPVLSDYHPIESEDPKPLLALATDWIHTTAGEAGVAPDVLPPETPVRREANTMPGWAGSCWYYLRFCDPWCDDRFVSREAERYWMSPAPARKDARGGETPARPGGVDLYVGGAEHAVLHLLYARFWHKILFDLGEVSTEEPMARLFHQGMITSYAYQRADRSLAPMDAVEETADGSFVERATGETVEQVIAKMSKSLKNVINPDDIIEEYGADSFRLYEMYMGPLEATKPWNTRDLIGLFRFLQRTWRIFVDETTGEPSGRIAPAGAAPAPDAEDLERTLHQTIAGVTQDIEGIRLNTAIAKLIEMTNAMMAFAGTIPHDLAARFLVILSPFAPHLAEELWSRLGRPGSVAEARWPDYDEAMLTADTIELPVQIMGKVRGRVTVPAGATAEEIEAAALADPRIRELIGGKKVRKVVVVVGKIVNVVVG